MYPPQLRISFPQTSLPAFERTSFRLEQDEGRIHARAQPAEAPPAGSGQATQSLRVKGRWRGRRDQPEVPSTARLSANGLANLLAR